MRVWCFESTVDDRGKIIFARQGVSLQTVETIATMIAEKSHVTPTMHKDRKGIMC
jgi:hypothetical protein